MEKGNYSIKELSIVAHQIAKEHGWWDGKPREFAELSMLIVCEVSEAVEEYRNGHEPQETYYSKDKQGNDKMEGIPSELADIVIRVADMCGHYGIDLEKAILEKIEYNKSRPYKHGNKKI